MIGKYNMNAEQGKTYGDIYDYIVKHGPTEQRDAAGRYLSRYSSASRELSDVCIGKKSDSHHPPEGLSREIVLTRRNLARLCRRILEGSASAEYERELIIRSED